MRLISILNKSILAATLCFALCLATQNGFSQQKKRTSKSRSKTQVKKRSALKSRKKTTAKYKRPIQRSIYLTKKTWTANPGIPKDSSFYLSDYLLSNDPIYTSDWSNAILFSQKSLTDTTDEIVFNLVKNDEKFTLTWYGRMNSVFGYRWGKQHQGLDLSLNFGDTVVAAFDGIVRYAKSNSGGYGNCIVIRHNNGLETLYGHLNSIKVSENQFVKSGELIGLGGSTGHSTGPHLHFETRYKGIAIDPQLLIDISTQQLKSETVIFDKNDLKSNTYPTTSPPNDVVEKKTVSKSKRAKKGKISSSKKKKPVKKSSKSTKKKAVASKKKTPAKKAPAKKKR